MGRHTKEEAQLTRERILDTAECEFQSRGVSHTSLQCIARAAGLTRGAIYWHFKDKADLFEAMMRRATLPLEQQIRRSGDPALDDPLQHIRDSLVAALQATVDQPQARRVFDIALHKVEYVDEMQGLRDRRLRGLRERLDHIERGLKRARRQGGCGPGGMPARVAALGLHSLVDGLIQNWMLDPGAFDLVRVGRQAIDVYLQGLAQAAPAAAERVGAAEPAAQAP